MSADPPAQKATVIAWKAAAVGFDIATALGHKDGGDSATLRSCAELLEETIDQWTEEVPDAS